MNTSPVPAPPSAAATSAFPDSLYAATPAAGHQLAARLAADLLQQNSPAASATMADMLRHQPAETPPSLVTAIYFHAISLANRGWRS